MSLEQVKQYVDFMRDDLVTLSTENSLVLVGEGASDEVRAEVRKHNANPGAREMKMKLFRTEH